MGNVQAASIANQLLPIESYVADVPALRFSHSLCATRFMKVGRVDHVGGPMVAKVFVLIDQTFDVEPYQQQVMAIFQRLAASPNCCLFSRIYMTPRSAILCRRFAKYTLHTRLSTRPFLLDVERRWIVFQLLRALDQCRAAGVCHGDIKAENVLVSSSLWIQLTDFASFKPAFLPYDNPSTFTFFFDTSRRRSCNLAPERFRTSADINYAPRFPNDAMNIAEGLIEAMDVFATGCVIAELLVDGRRTLFTLAQAVDYARVDDERAARAHIARLLHDGGVPDDFHPLLAAMLERNPTRRLEEFHKVDVSALFPSVFADFLYEYLCDLNGKPDDLITKLYVERDNYLPRLAGDEISRECAVLFANYVTSSVRACRTLPAKMDAITLMHELAKVWPALTGDRIVPYLTQMVSDAFPQARAESINVLAEVLELYEPSVQEDCRLLIDFVFPKLKTITLDTSNHVKSVLAANLGRLAMISLRYMEEGFRKLREEMTAAKGGPSGGPPDEFVESERLLIQTERGALQAVLNELFVNLCGSDNEVRHSLFEPANLELLCQFSGADRAIDILMHMITVLNDKPDWRMRAAFYASCPVVASHLGQVRCGKLLPFLQQGLQDSQEFVVYECLCCIYALCDRQLLSKRLICEIMRDVAPFLVHPNKWLRVAVANILTVFQSTFDVADLYVKIRPLVRPFFREDLIVFSTARVILKTLKEPIPRTIWNYLVGYPRIGELINLLENDCMLSRLNGGKADPGASATDTETVVGLDGAPADLSDSISFEDGSSTRSALVIGASRDVESVSKRLAGLGMDAEVAEKLLALRNVLYSANFTLSSVERSAGSSSANSNLSNPAYVRLQNQPRARRRVFNMATGECRIFNSNGVIFRDFLGDPLAMSGSAPRPNSAAGVLQANVSVSRFMLEETLRHKRDTYLRQLRVTSDGSAHEIARQLADAMADGNADGAAAACDNDEADIAQSRRHGHLFNPFTVGTSLPDDGGPTPTDGRPGGPAVQLLCTTNEHTDKIVGLTLHPDLNSFASCSRDGLVKLWAADALTGASHTVPAAMSRSTFRYGRPFTACGYLPASGHLALASEDRVLQLCDQNVGRVLRTFVADERDGTVTRLQCHGKLIYAITQHSAVYAFDPRDGGQAMRQRGAFAPIWHGQLRNSYGLITSFSVDPTAQHWAVFTGSSATTKNMIMWDLRFTGLEVAAWSTNNAQAITLGSWPLAHGTRSTQLLTAASKEAEVSLWDLTTQTRTDVLWSAHTKPLVYVNESVTTALTPSCVNPNMLLTGDSDGALRCWNLQRADRCAYLCGPYRKRAGQPLESKIDTTCHIRYEQRQCADRMLRVHVELLERTDAPSAIGQEWTDYHHDCITDLLSVWSELIVSSGRDGVIKLWKMI